MNGALRLLAGAHLLGLAAGCGEPAPPSPPAGAPAAQAAPTRGVVAQRLAGCEAPTEELPTPPEDVEERVDGLLATLASGPARMRDIALEELDGLGQAVVATLEIRLADRSLDAATRVAATEALGRLGAGGSRPAAEALLARLESSRGALEPEPWLYARCAWRLGQVDQAWVVPRLLLCLKYETDHDTVVWIADSLARNGLLAGLDALFVVAREGADAVRAEAEGVLGRLQAEVGASDWADLAQRWRLGQEPPSQRLEQEAYVCEVWSCIAALAEWQLRGVDDARFVLSRLGSGEARLLGEALADESVYVRLHAAQCLERMGPRGAPAGADLLARLDDPQVGPQAAAALGAVGHTPAVAALVERSVGAHPLELRVASMRALGLLAPPDLGDTARALLASDEPVDLRCAAAVALVGAAPAAEPPTPADASALQLLVDLLVSGEVEPRLAEDALGAWLGRRAEAGDATAGETLEAWLAVPVEPQPQRLRRRADLLAERASALGL